jgi:cysteine desulfurase/selenocysteine lyase
VNRADNLARTPAAATSRPRFDVEGLKADFPILNQEVHGKPLVYLDNAATSQKPRRVINTLARYYELDNANVHRAVHTLASRATFAYERARGKVHTFLNAPDMHQIVFTRGTTESINLVAQSYGRSTLKSGDEILLTQMEHHSNIVPWQLLAEQTGARIVVAPVTGTGELDMDAFERLLGERTKIVGAVHVSNALGTINPVKQITSLAHRVGAVVIIDGAQAAPHLKIDVQDIDCDFYAFSAHKVYGPTGVGALYGKRDFLEKMPPWQGGGEMILSVSFEKTTYNEIPYKFEAGTPPIAGAIGLGEALDYLSGLNYDALAEHEHDVLAYADDALRSVPKLEIIGTAKEKTGVHSFLIEGVHPHDIGTILDHEGIAIRTGNHCAQPIMTRFGVPATARASFAIYNTREDVDRLIEGLAAVRKLMG